MMAFYDAAFALSMILVLIYVFLWHRHFDVLISLTFVLVPITNLGYMLLIRTESLEAAVAANKLTYLGGCDILLLVMLTSFSLCEIRLSRWLRTGFVALSTIVYLSALTTGQTGWFYRSVTFERVGGAVLLHKEYGVMKKPAAERGRIVGEILEGTEDEDFRRIAENVAHYHHKRWDGTGYPEGLRGEDIPIEARIMAIADVYDALVSRRVYKESFSFDRADAIVLEGMGKQFDASLENSYRSARPELERFYRSLE